MTNLRLIFNHIFKKEFNIKYIVLVLFLFTLNACTHTIKNEGSISKESSIQHPKISDHTSKLKRLSLRWSFLSDTRPSELMAIIYQGDMSKAVSFDLILSLALAMGIDPKNLGIEIAAAGGRPSNTQMSLSIPPPPFKGTIMQHNSLTELGLAKEKTYIAQKYALRESKSIENTKPLNFIDVRDTRLIDQWEKDLLRRVINEYGANKIIDLFNNGLFNYLYGDNKFKDIKNSSEIIRKYGVKKYINLYGTNNFIAVYGNKEFLLLNPNVKQPNTSNKLTFVKEKFVTSYGAVKFINTFGVDEFLKFNSTEKFLSIFGNIILSTR